MAQPTTRTEFIDWCLRALGAPVIEINVDLSQVEDRVDEALSFYSDYHHDGTFETYYYWDVTQDDVDRGWLEVPEHIVGITEVLEADNSFFNFNDSDFSIEKKFVNSALLGYGNITSGLTAYKQAMSDISLFRHTLMPLTRLGYNRQMNQLHIHHKNLVAGTKIAASVVVALDPETYNDIWKDRWLQKYATAKIKYLWGQNVSKFLGQQLVGGIEFDGTRLIDEASEEIQKLEEEMINSYSRPISIHLG